MVDYYKKPFNLARQAAFPQPLHYHPKRHGREHDDEHHQCWGDSDLEVSIKLSFKELSGVIVAVFYPAASDKGAGFILAGR